MRKKKQNKMLIDINREVYAALERWRDSINYFENVSDPDLVDYAIFDMEANRRKYMIMLKKYRELQSKLINE